MKKIILISLILLIGIFSACGQTITIIMEGGTLAWDASLDTDNNPYPAGEIQYEVYESDYPVQEPDNLAAHRYLGITFSTEFPVTLGVKKTAFAVRAVRTNDGDTVYSTLAWSYIAEDADPAIGAWIARWLPKPEKPKKVRI